MLPRSKTSPERGGGPLRKQWWRGFVEMESAHRGLPPRGEGENEGRTYPHSPPQGGCARGHCTRKSNPIPPLRRGTSPFRGRQERETAPLRRGTSPFRGRCLPPRGEGENERRPRSKTSPERGGGPLRNAMVEGFRRSVIGTQRPSPERGRRERGADLLSARSMGPALPCTEKPHLQGAGGVDLMFYL